MRHMNCRQERERNRKVRETCVGKAAAMVYMDRKLGRKPRIRESAKRISVR